MSFISTGNLNASVFTSAYDDFFDYFKKEVVVYKTPKKTVADVSLSFLYGYGTDSNGDNYTFTPVSGIFSGLAVYGSNVNNRDLFQADIRMPDNNLRLKVTEEASNYINNGANESIEVDNKKYFVKSSDTQEHFLTNNYFVYILEEAN
tara:strand:- start:1327 stop:1770 length:444 start_codon:yes stop_codon:yes gene_type:complete